jgi:hypothetical protein
LGSNCFVLGALSASNLVNKRFRWEHTGKQVQERLVNLQARFQEAPAIEDARKIVDPVEYNAARE